MADETTGQNPSSGQTLAVHVRRALSANWWVVDTSDEALSQSPSEFAAVDAGNINARRPALPLIIHDGYHERIETPVADEE